MSRLAEISKKLKKVRVTKALKRRMFLGELSELTDPAKFAELCQRFEINIDNDFQTMVATEIPQMFDDRRRQGASPLQNLARASTTPIPNDDVAYV